MKGHLKSPWLLLFIAYFSYNCNECFTFFRGHFCSERGETHIDFGPLMDNLNPDARTLFKIIERRPDQL